MRFCGLCFTTLICLVALSLLLHMSVIFYLGVDLNHNYELVSQAVFQRYLRPEKEYLSFSLIYNNGKRSLDLVGDEPNFLYYFTLNGLFAHNYLLYITRSARTKLRQKTG